MFRTSIIKMYTTSIMIEWWCHRLSRDSFWLPVWIYLDHWCLVKHRIVQVHHPPYLCNIKCYGDFPSTKLQNFITMLQKEVNNSLMKMGVQSWVQVLGSRKHLAILGDVPCTGWLISFQTEENVTKARTLIDIWWWWIQFDSTDYSWLFDQVSENAENLCKIGSKGFHFLWMSFWSKTNIPERVYQSLFTSTP